MTAATDEGEGGLKSGRPPRGSPSVETDKAEGNGTEIHPHIRADGHSSLLAWVKLVGVHPMPPSQKKQTKSVAQKHGDSDSPGQADGPVLETQAPLRQRELEEKRRPRPIRTKTRIFRFAGRREVTQLIVRKSCIVVATKLGAVELFAWPAPLQLPTEGSASLAEYVVAQTPRG